MRKLAGVIGGLSVIWVSLTGAAVDAKPADTDASQCVGMSRTELDRSLEVEVQNGCDRKMACQVTWKLSCEDEKGKVTRKSAGKATVQVDAEGAKTLEASATSCKDTEGWLIDDVRWSCKEAK